MGQTINIQDTLDHMKQKDTDDDYGWLSPNGTFYPGEFGSHVASGIRLAKKFYPEQCADPENNLREDDILYQHNWILMHNPTYGTATPNYKPEARITKAQRDFIYNYYMKRGKNGLADRYMKELQPD